MQGGTEETLRVKVACDPAAPGVDARLIGRGERVPQRVPPPRAAPPDDGSRCSVECHPQRNRRRHVCLARQAGPRGGPRGWDGPPPPQMPHILLCLALRWDGGAQAQL